MTISRLPTKHSITCPQCSRTSHHPQDIAYGFCGHCHEYTGKPAATEAELLKVGTTLCPMVLTATGRPCLGTLVPSGIANMNQCTRCGTWVGASRVRRA